MPTRVRLSPVDLSNPDHARVLPDLLNEFAQDPMSRGSPLTSSVLDELVPRLRERNDFWGFLAFVDEQPAGFVLGFESFSTFAARPLINVHDLFVTPEFRGHGVGKRLMQRVETLAQRRNCCKITLEVRRDNEVARSLYRRMGYEGVEQGANDAEMLFRAKYLS